MGFILSKGCADLGHLLVAQDQIGGLGWDLPAQRVSSVASVTTSLPKATVTAWLAPGLSHTAIKKQAQQSC